MKKTLLIILSLIIMMAMSGCEDLPNCEDSAVTDSTTGESNNSFTSRDIDVSLRSNVQHEDSRTAITSGDIISVSFRSSDIEFWSTELAEGYTSLISDLYSNEESEQDKVSVSFDLPDTSETFKFIAGTIHEVEDATINFANTIYDIIRIDIGGGGFDFNINEIRVSPVNTITGETSGINGNSIFLISSTLLENNTYVPRTDFYDSKEELIAAGRDIYNAIRR